MLAVTGGRAGDVRHGDRARHPGEDAGSDVEAQHLQVGPGTAQSSDVPALPQPTSTPRPRTSLSYSATVPGRS
ncbi:hypothetical protein [Streptomyces guryensis]|uniref:Uncharacterized protein n=1 Tax=Streptomyces guryensis TaxID=2886947 RepID=A0A9Q3VMU1_9ACTN|nr:hypothetical protein [Streptomyces guryensis]MCD9873891.1 hypothetical protein [Streptomyces guryensis]